MINFTFLDRWNDRYQPIGSPELTIDNTENSEMGIPFLIARNASIPPREAAEGAGFRTNSCVSRKREAPRHKAVAAGF